MLGTGGRQQHSHLEDVLHRRLQVPTRSITWKTTFSCPLVAARGPAGASTSTRYAFRGTLGKSTFQSASKSLNLGHFDKNSSNACIIGALWSKFLQLQGFWGILKKCPKSLLPFGAF
jgi:hypothetical protein